MKEQQKYQKAKRLQGLGKNSKQLQVIKGETKGTGNGNWRPAVSQTDRRKKQP